MYDTSSCEYYDFLNIHNGSLHKATSNSFEIDTEEFYADPLTQQTQIEVDSDVSGYNDADAIISDEEVAESFSKDDLEPKQVVVVIDQVKEIPGKIKKIKK